MKAGERIIESGREFNHLFPSSEGSNLRIKKSADLADTVALMKKVIGQTLPDTKELSKLLASGSQRQTCKRVWDFCFTHLQYRKDEEGIEQVRRPARTWSDRKQGVDCDCMTVFICSILSNLGIKFLIRLTRNSFGAAGFEHVYPVAITNQGKVIMDCVVHSFDYEAPYLEKKDITMELQYLNGFDDSDFDDFEDVDSIDGWEDEFDDDLQGLAGKAKRQQKKADRKAKRAEKKANKPPLKERIKKGIHAINKLNPATALLRAGILASLKLNLMNVAGRLRYTYWTDAQAQQNNVDLQKFQQLKQIREKIEKVFYGAGGTPDNMKKAILTGRGNRNRAVVLSGLGYVPVYEENNLRHVLGEDIYADEFDSVEHPSGFSGLGSITAASAIAAASGIIGTIAGFLKKLGSIFKKGSSEEQQDILQDNTSASEDKKLPYSPDEISTYLDDAKAALAPPSSSESDPPDDAEEPDDATAADANLPAVVPQAALAPVATTDQSDPTPKSTKMDTNTPAPTKAGAWQWIQDHPITSVGIAVAAIGGAFLIVKAVKNAKNKKSPQPAVNGLNGVRSVKRKKTTKKRKSTASGGSHSRRTIKKIKLL